MAQSVKDARSVWLEGNIPYVVDFVQYTSSQASFNISSLCNSITFINSGTVNVTLNNGSLVLQPGQSVAIQGNQFEVDTTQYNGYFAAATGGILTVVRKSYLHNPEMAKAFKKANMAYGG